MYIIIQIICLLFAFALIGNINANSPKFDKIACSTFATVFVLMAIYIEGVLK